MKRFVSTAALFGLFSLAPLAAEGLSGTWVAGTGPAAQVFIFRVRADTFLGVVCGPCDDPATAFRIVDGKVLDGQHATFVIVHDDGGPLFKQFGPYRDQVTATQSGSQLTLQIRREGGTDPPVGMVLKRVVERADSQK